MKDNKNSRNINERNSFSIGYKPTRTILTKHTHYTKTWNYLSVGPGYKRSQQKLPTSYSMHPAEEYKPLFSTLQSLQFQL